MGQTLGSPGAGARGVGEGECCQTSPLACQGLSVATPVGGKSQVAGHHGEPLLQGGGGDQQVGAERRLAIPRSMPEGSPAVAIA